jgi:hypothetical protein
MIFETIGEPVKTPLQLHLSMVSYSSRRTHNSLQESLYELRYLQCVQNAELGKLARCESM